LLGDRLGSMPPNRLGGQPGEHRASYRRDHLIRAITGALATLDRTPLSVNADD